MVDLHSFLDSHLCHTWLLIKEKGKIPLLQEFFISLSFEKSN